ncbi:DUF4917 family protein [Candidatus Peregrinibacteria bacterium]|nr:MAG: DUF4917 family protein [Candidatus Peregrinibacteria bacterium]
MSDYPKIFSFEEVKQAALKNNEHGKCNKGIHLLLGNGFSQAYYKDFGYTTLFDAVKDAKENERIKKVFEYFGTSNFEAVLSLLKHTIYLSSVYGFDKGEIETDYNKVRDALAGAIVKVHPEKTTEIPPENKLSCYQFLSQFDGVYTVNYDLLLYWTVLQDPNLDFGDYFNRDGETPKEYCEYIEDGGRSKKHVLFLHGALHLFLKNGTTIKKVWGSTVPLIDQIKDEINRGYYPLVVAEGDSKSKRSKLNLIHTYYMHTRNCANKMVNFLLLDFHFPSRITI